MTKKIAVIAVRIAVEVEEGATAHVVTDKVRHVLNQAEEEGRILNWEFDEWGIDYDDLSRHIFEVADDFDPDEGVPQIRDRSVRSE